ncbi:RNA polymerase primary sigma factor/RNA polymerase nonessential primary-like sigma factor [Microlunatus flavus]|uniref:RNA polymerase primary sigma factor/RNA polymerase nonessential primary-like sigma factor n=1 Tax=Microlunatus flavus TaxID=1036181 RepID=A0A1H9N0Q5_9ACTN|nr:RNA polymerase primary sigma factor/RNA polymerase nonessential primary-like sigma factor [Microlunatus flavus]
MEAWARAVEAGVLARAARDDPGVAWRGDATDEELETLAGLGVRAQQEFVTANLGLVGSVLARHARRGASPADLFQEGCLGLMAAVERFDHRRGVRFSTYAGYWIRTCVTSSAARASEAVSMPASRSEQLRVVRAVEAGLVQRLARQPSVGEVARALGRDEAWTAQALGHRAPRSIDDVDEAVLHRSAGGDDPPATGAAGVGEESWARRLLATLDGFDQRVVELRMGFDGREPASLAATARELGVPVGRVRRSEVRALELLRSRCPQTALAGLAS